MGKAAKDSPGVGLLAKNSLTMSASPETRNADAGNVHRNRPRRRTPPKSTMGPRGRLRRKLKLVGSANMWMTMTSRSPTCQSSLLSGLSDPPLIFSFFPFHSACPIPPSGIFPPLSQRHFSHFLSISSAPLTSLSAPYHPPSPSLFHPFRHTAPQQANSPPPLTAPPPPTASPWQPNSKTPTPPTAKPSISQCQPRNRALPHLLPPSLPLP